jgi:hypothetical protein
MPWLAAIAVVASLWHAPVQAQTLDWSLSGFGTAAYAVSNRNEKYLRFIDKEGTFRSDSIAGAQLDGKLTTDWGQFGATIQAVAKPSDDKDTGLQPTLSWAFLSYRPNNEWLFRAGKYRPPLFIHMQNMEVGTTYDEARLPQEIYPTSPIYDVVGLTAAKSWSTGNGDTTLEGYWGRTTAFGRAYDPIQQAATYAKYDVEAEGAVLSYQDETLLLRSNFTLAKARLKSGSGLYPGDVEPTINIAAPAPLGGNVYVPTRGKQRDIVSFVSLGADWNIDDNWRITTEYTKRWDQSKIGLGGQAGYVTLFRKVGDFVPYVGFSRVLTNASNGKRVRELEYSAVPTLANLPATYHRTLASMIPVLDQASFRLGSSYNLSPTAKIKAEWMFTHVGQESTLFDGGPSGMNANVFTLSFSKSF